MLDFWAFGETQITQSGLGSQQFPGPPQSDIYGDKSPRPPGLPRQICILWEARAHAHSCRVQSGATPIAGFAVLDGVIRGPSYKAELRYRLV